MEFLPGYGIKHLENSFLINLFMTAVFPTLEGPIIKSLHL